jgi:signal transduction histidine kinase
MGWKGLDPLRGLKVSWIVLPVCLLLSLAGWAWMRDRVARETGEALQRRGDLLRVALEDQFRTYATTLQESALLVQIHGGNRKAVLGEFLDELSHRDGFSGFFGVGYAEREAAEGEAADRLRTVAIAAMDDHRPHVIGLDHASVPARAEAIARARDSGHIALTQPVCLAVDPPDAVPGSVVVYLPVYRGFSTPVEPAARGLKLAGVIFSPLPLKPFMKAMTPALEDGVLIGIHDEASGLEVYHSEGWPAPGAALVPTAKALVRVGGRTWVVQLRAAPAFQEQVSHHRPGQWLAVLLVGSLLFFATSASLEGSRDRAVRMADALSAEVREAAAKNAALLDAMPDMVFIHDTEGRFLAFRATAGVTPLVSPEAFLGRMPADVLPADVAQAIDQGFLRLRATGQPVVLEYSLGEGASLRHFEGRLVPAGSGQVLGLVRDVTERRQMEWALSQARKTESLQLMAGGIAHDFNNLFQGFVGFLELALAETPATAPAHLLLRRMQGLLDRGIKLSSEMLLYTGRGFRRREPLDLQEIVAASGLAETISCEADPDLSLFEGDPGQISGLVRILIENAREATPAGARRPRLRVARAIIGGADLDEGLWPRKPEPGPHLMLEVTDEGEGIPPAALDQIFDPFYSTRSVGRGLGLSAALGIIRSHEGFIQMVSRPGAGTRVRVLFPLNPA